VAVFFIETSTGQVATGRQLDEAGLMPPSGVPPRPWHRVSGTGDASTMWYAVMRKQVRDGVYIGTLVLRHSEHEASLRREGWHEVPVNEISAPA
jgi:hypothetical protein